MIHRRMLTPSLVSAPLQRRSLDGEHTEEWISAFRRTPPSSVNAFSNDPQLIRLTERIAFGVGQPGYLAVLSTSAS